MKRNKFSLSHQVLLSCDMGELIPIGWVDVLPGDTFQHATSALIRTQPLLAPVMHPIDARIHHWFVPLRLLWDDFEKFITGGPDGMDSTVRPTISVNNHAVGSLTDYLGVPPLVAAARSVSALPYRAYAEIFNQWYRDQDLVDPLVVSKGNGVDSTTSVELQKIAWEKDRFTSSRPWEMKGPDISLPIGGIAPVQAVPASTARWPVRGIGIEDGVATTGSGTFRDATGASIAAAPTADNNQVDVATGNLRTRTIGPDGTVISATKYPDIRVSPGDFPAGMLETDLTGATAASIVAVREAFALLRYQEARARFGSRYTEYLAYLGVRSPDARLQRPEYLGGGRQTIQFSEVLQTAEGTNAVGTMRGHGINAMRSNRYRKFFTEHGIVMSLLSVRPKTVYMNGLFRKWNRETKEDYWQKELEHIGQAEVLNKEVYMAHATPDGVFGYQDRFDEYRREESRVAGEFRTTDLNFWHLARDLSGGGDPALNSTFVTSTPTKRVFPVTNKDVLYVNVKHHLVARRQLSQVGSSFIY